MTMRHRAAHHVEGGRGVPGAGAGEALGQRGGVEVVHPGREEDQVPAVGDLGRQRDVLRPLGAQVDGDLRAVGMQDRAQRLAQAGAAAQRQLVVPAVVGDRLGPGDDRAQDLDVLPGPLQRARVGLAVPALDHLRVAGADADDDPALGQVVHGHGGHGQGGRRPGGELGDAGAQLDVRGPRAPPGQRGPGVAAVGLGGPDLIEAQPVGGGEQLGRVRRRPRAPVADGGGDPHFWHDTGSAQAGQAAERLVGLLDQLGHDLGHRAHLGSAGRRSARPASAPRPAGRIASAAGAPR